jgi:hypothetical protein
MIAPGDFRSYLRRLAGGVWSRQAMAHTYGLSLQEETITELLLLEMARTFSPLGLQVRMFSKQEEGGKTQTIQTLQPDGTTVKTTQTLIEAEGADWEWVVEGPFGCSALFRVQAKKLYRDVPMKKGRYGGFKPKGKQIDDLINRAALVGANPIYVFYNHPDVLDNTLFGPTRYPDFFGRNCWGCAVTTAQFMKHAKDEKLATIKPGTVPWHRFFSVGNGCLTRKAMTTISAMVASETKEEPQVFIPAEDRPDWVERLRGETDLSGYLIERNLQGVAHIDASELRG